MDRDSFATLAIIATVAVVAPLVSEVVKGRIPGVVLEIGRGIVIGPQLLGWAATLVLAIGAGGEFLPIVVITLLLSGDNYLGTSLLLVGVRGARRRSRPASSCGSPIRVRTRRSSTPNSPRSGSACSYRCSSS